MTRLILTSEQQNFLNEKREKEITQEKRQMFRVLIRIIFLSISVTFFAIFTPAALITWNPLSPWIWITEAVSLIIYFILKKYWR